MENEHLERRRRTAMPRGVAVLCHVHADQATNAALKDVEGREYLDFASGIAVLNTGHRHPRVLEAVRRQLDRFMHTAFQIVPYESAIALAERINQVVPIRDPVKTAFFTTGAEAVENAVKIVRAHTGRSAVISFGGGFHGRTMMGLALTGKVTPYKAGFGPFAPEVHHARFLCTLDGVSVDDAMASIDMLFKATVEPARVAAILIEPVQGEKSSRLNWAAMRQCWCSTMRTLTRRWRASSPPSSATAARPASARTESTCKAGYTTKSPSGSRLPSQA